MTRPVAVSLLCLVLAAPAAARVGDPDALASAHRTFQEANDAFLSGESDQALSLYRQLVADGFGTADVQFNLGNAALASGKLGEAIVAYHRALRLEPGHAGAQTNLRIAEARNVDRVIGAGGPSFLERLARALPAGGLTAGFLAAWLALFGVWLARRLGAGPRGALTAAGVALAIASGVLGAGLAGVTWVRETRRVAVVLASSAEVREGPAPRFRSLFEVHEGLEVRWLDSEGPYARIRLANGLDGWVLRKSIEAI